MSTVECYPKWLYHAERGAVLVSNKAEHEALGSGYAESPADVVPSKPTESAEIEKPKKGKKA